VQVAATSVGELKSFEVEVKSEWIESPDEQPNSMARWIEARDACAADLTYDGRESAGALPVSTSFALPGASRPWLLPSVFAPPGAEPDRFYVEMVQPNDATRRIVRKSIDRGSGARLALSNRYGLFGHDLEKGVVLRARLRGLWIVSRTPADDSLSLYQEFLREPAPLGP
jgi:hypothetical protein